MDNLIFFVLGIVYMIGAISIGLRVDDKCKRCLTTITGENEIYFYILLVLWPISIPFTIYRSRSILSESDVIPRDWH